MDTIGDFLTIIRNAVRAQKSVCKAHFSNMRKEVALLLKQEGYIANVNEICSENGLKDLEVQLKYVKGVSVLNVLKRCSKPGARWYVRKDKIPSVLSGLGICILSTSRGILSGKQARQMRVGGELICKVW
ncbi:MAG: 30S ribosomal protein S8 [Puniceicoccales bacterium]|jgi:small subunit ribosomal protein S8|nr:30S ribosomal protein S8 [Puniceicoccales bacterium]